MEIGGDIPTWELILFPMMSKGEKEKESSVGILSWGFTLFYQIRRGTWRET
jgi:hypothetical protein